MFVVPEIIALAFGWIGALCAVSAYGAVTAKRISSDSAMFQGLNLVGAAMLCVSAYSHGAWPSAIVNVVWIGIGIFALRALWTAHQAKLAVAAPAVVALHDVAMAELIVLSDIVLRDDVVVMADGAVTMTDQDGVVAITDQNDLAIAA